MIIPSIDLQNGHAVQLIGGKEMALDAGDPRPIADSFGRVGEVAVIDLDAAFGTGSNREVILDLLKRAPCRVGGLSTTKAEAGRKSGSMPAARRGRAARVGSTATTSWTRRGTP